MKNARYLELTARLLDLQSEISSEANVDSEHRKNIYILLTKVTDGMLLIFVWTHMLKQRVIIYMDLVIILITISVLLQRFNAVQWFNAVQQFNAILIIVTFVEAGDAPDL